MRLRSGFTLIELSIALVIIGLLVGGIFTGLDLVKASETRSVISDLEKYKTAISAFELKYDCLPGDCVNINSSFSTALNGNGDGFINPWWVWGSIEGLETWNHLSLANLITGNYKNTFPGNVTIDLGKTSPATKFNPNIGYTIHYTLGPTRPSTASLQVASYNLPLGDGDEDFLWGSGLTATQTKYIDDKMDDGAPNTGQIKGTTPNGASPANSSTACLDGSFTKYKLDGDNSGGCILFYKLWD
jgi:prepilin-type N-terminal cleavage/methylation domain-containing protein